MTIVIDFESNKAGELFILGYRYQGEFKQIILDRRLEGLTQHQQYALDYMAPPDAAKMIVEKAKKSMASVAGYTMVDKTILAQQLGNTDFDYVNLHSIAKKWINKNFYVEFRDEKNPPDWSLKSVSEFFGYPAERDYARGQTTARINSVISGLKAKKGMYANLTRVQKTKATKLLKHNEFDVNAASLILQVQRTSRDPQSVISAIREEAEKLSGRGNKL